MKLKQLSSFDPTRRDRQVYVTLLALYAIVLYPILRANRPYEDDLGRVLIGRTGWDSNGRPLATLLMRILQCYNHAMVDISPLTQIGAIAALAWVGVLLARRFDIRSTWAAALAAFPLGAQPFFLENLSYKFDALSMGLAVLFAALPVLSPATGRRGWWLGILWMFCCLNLYQAAINVYLLFALLEMVMMMVRQEPPSALRRRFVWRVSQALTGMVIYQLLIGATMIRGWVGRHVGKIHRVDELLQLPANIATFFRYIDAGFSEQWRIYFLPLLILMAVAPLVVGIGYAWKQRETQPAWITAGLLLVGLALPVIGLLGMMGPLLMLAKPFLAGRVMIGVGAWLSMGLVVAYAALEQWRRSPRWMLAASGMLALGMAVIASAYGNALGEQRRYEAHIASRLADDYAAMDRADGVRALLLDGSAGYAPVTGHAIAQMPILGSMINPYLTAGDSFHTPQFLAYYLPSVPYIRSADDTEDQVRMMAIKAKTSKTCAMTAWRHARAYDLYKVDDIAVAVFSHPSTDRCDGAADTAAAGIDEDALLIGIPLKSPE
jgi:hypothetical protein